MKNSRILYEHPNGGHIEFDPVGRELVAIDADGTIVFVGIGPLGMIELSKVLYRTGRQWRDDLREQGSM